MAARSRIRLRREKPSTKPSPLNGPQSESRPLLELQRQAGNAAVDMVIQRQVGASDVEDSLVGLQRGDGLNFGTEDRRPSVSLLQQRLNEHMQAGIDVDGMFGPKTSEMLREFQEALRLPQQEPVDEVTAQALNAPVGEVPVPGGAPTPDQAGKAARIAFAGEQLDVAADGIILGGQDVLAAGGQLGLSLTAPAAGVDLNVAGLKIIDMATSLKRAAAALKDEGARQQTTTTVAGSANPLVGLKRGDGFVFGTFERRPRVSLLQNKLNEQGGAGLESDGMWGPLTSDALATFQAAHRLPVQDQVDADTADALMGTGIASPSGPLPASLGGAGEKLQEAATQITRAATSLLLAGGGLIASASPPSVSAGATLQRAANDLISAAPLLAAAGQGLTDASGDPTGVPSATLRSAGTRLTQAGQLGSDAGGRIGQAGGDLASSPDSGELQASPSMIEAGVAWLLGAQAFGDAGRALTPALTPTP